VTITSTVNRKEYTGNGTTTDFSFPYYVLASGDLSVYLDGVLKTITTDYTLSLTPPQTAGVDVQFLTPPASSKSVVIIRDPAITQSTDLIENDPLPAEELEKTVDRLTMICQRLDERMGRAAILPDTDVSGASPILPAPLANAHIAWNSTADALTTATALAGSETVSAYGATLIDDANAAAARTTLGLSAIAIKALSDAFAWSGVHTYTGLSPLKFDGAVAGGNAFTFTFVEPTANRTITFPNENVDLGNISKLLPIVSVKGCGITPAGSSASMPIAAGTVIDSTDAKVFAIAALTKTTSAWAVGSAAGGLDTGTIAANTTYHIFAILRSDTGVTDYLFSLSATAPTLPTNYDFKKRIGSWRTDGSSQWYKGHSSGDYFFWDLGMDAVFVRVTETDAGTSAVTRAMPIPLGVILFWFGTVNIRTFGTSCGVIVSSLTDGDAVADVSRSTVTVDFIAATARLSASDVSEIETDTSAQIRTRQSTSDSGTIINLYTRGWRDPRSD